MSREARRSKEEHRLKQLERDYIDLLDAALCECRAGAWGLFGQNDHLLKLGGPANTLISMGDAIRRARSELGIIEAFEPHTRYMHYRSLRGPNVPGEPALAEQLWHEWKANPSKLSSE
jgi:hypothetical protein